MTEEAGETIQNASDVVPNSIQAVADLLPDDVVDTPAQPEELEPANETDAETESDAEEDPKKKPAKDEPEKPEDEEPDAESEDEPEDDGKPWDEKRIKAEREKLEETRAAQEQEIGKKFAAVKRREAKAKQVLATAKTDRAQLQSMREAMLSDVQILRTGKAAEVVDVLSRVTGRPGREFIEEIVNNMAADGAPRESAELAELKRELAELKSGRQQQGQTQQVQEAIAASRRMIGQGVQSDDFPIIKSIATQNQAEFNQTCQDIEGYMVKQAKRGRVLDVGAALTEIEYKLVRAGKTPQTSPDPESGRPGRETRGNKKPAAAAQQPTVTPSTAAKRTGATRPLSDNERLRALHQFIPDE